MSDVDRNGMNLSFVESGADLVESLRLLARGADAWLQATGSVDGVELRVAIENTETSATLRGRFNLLTLAGARGGPFAVTLSRATDVGIEVVGGELVRARSLGVNVCMFSPRENDVRREPERREPERREPERREPERREPDARVAEKFERVEMPFNPGAWAKTAAASAAARAGDEHGDSSSPEAGDLVDHFAFGLCEVVTSDGERLRIRDLDGPKRVREVALTMLKVSGPTDSDGKRLFQLTRRTPG